jgi:hypothetical protein
MKPRQQKIVITTRIVWLVLLACAGLLVLCFQAGCQFVGMAAVLGSPTESEIKSYAEYNLAQHKGQKVLVLVDQSAHLNAHPNFRYLITDTINRMLQKRDKIKPSLLIDYDKLAEFHSSTSDFSLLSPEQVGSALGADLVLLVIISDYQIHEVAEAGYYSGSLDAQASLFKVATGEKLWPTLEQVKIVQVGFEAERKGPDAAAVRLAVAAGHCITRYLYDCPKNQFKISDERTATGWEK